ncbi:MAG: lipid-binding SYLF domain-containing protein [Planctomycetota bacterium]|nr:lipid-binding SYLF domain-containing protein [Planctomycetota bacterium]
MTRLITAISVALLTLLLTACGAKTYTGSEKQVMLNRVEETIDAFKRQDPSLASWFTDAYGYAVFPTIGKGAIGVGGAHGDGVVFSQNEPIGATAMSQATIGLQLGGQAYSELIFFRTKADLDDFTDGNFEFSAQASAVAASAGAGANADYEKGVAVFTMGEKGLMFEASLGGQKFSYKPFTEE